MAYEHKPGQGSIFKNINKTTDNHPDWKGMVVTPEGEKLDIALWSQQGQKGEYYSLKLQVPYVKPETQESKQPEPAQGAIDDLPF